jgi:hypothetical protein
MGAEERPGPGEVLMSPHVTRRLRTAIGAVAIIALLMVPGAASADEGGGGGPIPPAASEGATVRIDSVVLVSRLKVRVRISVVCEPIHYRDWETGEEGDTTDGRGSLRGYLMQAQGREIVTGFGIRYASAICDGSTVNHYSIAVLAQDRPFHSGPVEVGVEGWIDAGCPCDSWSDRFSSGAISKRLRVG